MNNFFRFLILTLGLGFLSHPALNLNGQNLLPNSEFEKVSGDNIEGWEVRGQNAGPVIATDAGYAMGKISVHLKTDTPKQEVLLKTSKPVSGIIPGKEYRLTFFARSPIPNQTIASSFYTSPTKAGHWRKTKSQVLTENWAKYSLVQRIPPEPEWANKPLVIRFAVTSGEAFLDDVFLEVNKEEGEASPNASRKNILDNPGFELGWLGWGAPPAGYIDSRPYQDPEVPSAIDTTVKYEGNASLRVEPNMHIVTRHYPVEVGQPYTVSFYARAVASSPGDDHKVQFYITSSNWKPITKFELELGKNLSSEWKRYSFKHVMTEQESKFLNNIYFRIQNNNLTLWLDAVQLEAGDKATDYSSDIQAGILTDSKTGIFTQGKPEPVQVAVYSAAGISNPVTVSLESRDGYSNLLWKQDVSFEPTRDKVAKKPLSFDTTRLGVQEVIATVKDSSGAPISVNKLRYMVIDGKPARQNPLFGTENLTGQPRYMETLSEEIANIGGSGFTRCRPAGNAETPFETAMMHEQYERKKKSGKIVVFEISNKFLTFSRAPEGVDWSEETLQKDLKAAAEYGKKIGKEFKDVVDIYQIFNEVNIWTIHSGPKSGTKKFPPKVYIRFVEAMSNAIRSVNPTAKITISINKVDLSYTEELFKLGVAKYIDLYAIHAYRAAAENPSVYDDIKQLRAVIDKYAPGMPIINDEQYYGVRDYMANNKEAEIDYYSDSHLDHAGRILQTYLHLVAADKVPFSIFAVDKTFYVHGMSNPFYYYFGFGGFRFMSQSLYDIESSSNVAVHPSARAFYFKRKDGTIVVSINTKSVDLKGGIRAASADEAYDYSGNPLDVKDVSFNYLPSYLFYKNKSVEEVVQLLKKGDIYGLDAPVRAQFEASGSSLIANVENFENKTVDAEFTITSMPEGWTIPAPVKLTGLEARGKKTLSFPIPPMTDDWNKDYTIGYRVVVGDQIVNKTQRLPSIFAKKKTINVDGDLSDWKDIPAIQLSEDNLSMDFSEGKLPHHGPQDLSASTSITWDDNNVYFSVQVTDDVFHVSKTGLPRNDQNSSMRVQLFQNDSLQFYFDMHNDATKDYDDNDTSFQVGLTDDGKPVAYLDRAPSGRYVGDNNQAQGIDDKVQVKFKKLEKGYQFEIAFSKDALPYLELKPGSLLGFSLLVNDNDGQGRKQGVYIGPKLKSPNIRPNQWRTIKLTE